MSVSGNGPQPTSPEYVSDEHVAQYALGDYALLCPHWATLGEGSDGSFDVGAPWVLNSPTVNFGANGVQAQNVVVCKSPPTAFPGGHHLFAVDSVSGNSCTLRRVGMPLSMGQPPSPATGLSGVTFSIPTAYNAIDNASYEIKRFLRIDEAIYWRNSQWVYEGAEDIYRVFRELTVLQAMAYLFAAQITGGDESADWIRKLHLTQARLDYMKGQVEIRWGPFGNSAQPTNPLGTRLSR